MTPERRRAPGARRRLRLAASATWGRIAILVVGVVIVVGLFVATGTLRL
jgi:hypothetical protein